MTTQMRKSQRREKEFTAPETLVRHPIVLLLGRREVKEVMSSRKRDDIRFSDLQYLLSQELPSSRPRDCPQVTDCTDCHKFKKCPSVKLKDWDHVFAAEQLTDMRVYSRKSHLHDDLSRLDNEGYVKKTGWGRYRLIEDERHRNAVTAIKKYLRRTLEKWPIETIISRESGVLFMQPGELREELGGDLDELDHLSDRVRNKLGELRIKSILVDIAAAYEQEFSRIENDKDKIHLQRYLARHIETRLASLGVDEDVFKDQLDSILGIQWDIDEHQIKRIEEEIEEEDRSVRDARKRISKAFWLEQERSSWAQKYDSLMKKRDDPLDKKEIRRTKEILQREESFQKWFEATSMCIPLNVLENSSIAVIEYSVIASTTPTPHRGQQEIDKADEVRNRKEV